MPKMSAALYASRYSLMLLLSCFALLAAVAGFNAVVDPFDLYRLVRIEGLNAYKPATYNRVRLYKAFELRRVRPQTIILGTSRTHLGLRCAHRAFAGLDEPCYNLAYDGATTREMYAYLRHAHAIRPLRRVVLGLDTYLLSHAPSFTRPGFDPLILRDAATPAWWRAVTGDLRLLTSVDTLGASIFTLRSQQWPEPAWFAPDGQRLGEVFFRRHGETFMRDGPRAYFDEIDRLEVGFQTPPAAASERRGSAVPGDFGVQLDESSIEQLIGEQRAAQLAYRQRYPEEVAALRRMVRAKTNNGGPTISAGLANYLRCRCLA